MDTHEALSKREVKIYKRVFWSLAILTGLTVAVSYLHLPMILAIAIALSIAAFKGGLVAAFFMHLSSEKKIIIVILLFTLFFFVGLLFLPLFTSAQHTVFPSGMEHVS